jgi:hypothetical protein
MESSVPLNLFHSLKRQQWLLEITVEQRHEEKWSTMSRHRSQQLCRLERCSLSIKKIAVEVSVLVSDADALELRLTE